MDDLSFYQIALDEAKLGLAEHAIPIGASLVYQNEVIGRGRNKRVQMGSVIRHGETDCLENAGRHSASVYSKCTLYTTLSPCAMCAGTVLLYKIPRVVIGENINFVGEEDLLRSRGVEVVVLDHQETIDMMRQFISDNPTLWNEDIGV